MADIAIRLSPPSQQDSYSKAFINRFNMGLFASHEYIKKHGTPMKNK